MNIYNAGVAIGVSLMLGLTAPFVAFAAGPAPIVLGSAGNFTILTKTGISTTGSTVVVGDIGVSPAAASAITGFALTLPAASAFSTSASVSGKVYAPGYADPTPADLTTAVLDMQNAYTDGAGRVASVTELGAGNIGGLTLAPGVYKWGTGVTIPTDVTLSGTAGDVWIFEIAQNLTVSSGVHIVLAGGAQAANIFWVVAGQTTIGTNAVFNGTILDQTAIVLNTGATLNGRALAQTAVTLDSNSVSAPAAVAVVVAPAPVSTSAATSTTTTSSTNSTNSGQATYTTTSTQTSAKGQAVTLGNGQTVYISSTGAFVDAQGNAVSNTTVSAAVGVRSASSSFGQQVKTIATSLGQGDRGSDVTILQQFLISQSKGPAAGALAHVGATSYFGALTRAALAEFQASVGISPALGNFGPVTRAYMSGQY